MKNVTIALSAVAAALFASANLAHAQAAGGPGGLRAPVGSVAAPATKGGQPPGGGGGDFTVQKSSHPITATPSAPVVASPHNPNASPEVEQGYQKNQQEHGRQ